MTPAVSRQGVYLFIQVQGFLQKIINIFHFKNAERRLKNWIKNVFEENRMEKVREIR
jgi:hypothetical protein